MANDLTPTLFFGYPSMPPLISETINAAAQEITQSGIALAKTWQDMQVAGRVVIDEICREIDKCSLFSADLTGLNQNVLFELGYAIGKDKQIWPIIDLSVTASTRDFDQLRTLTTLGYTNYSNSSHLTKAFYSENLHSRNDETLFQRAIAPNIRTDAPSNLLYLRGRHETNADIKITKRIGAGPIPQIVDDPKESALQTLT